MLTRPAVLETFRPGRRERASDWTNEGLGQDESRESHHRSPEGLFMNAFLLRFMSLRKNAAVGRVPENIWNLLESDNQVKQSRTTKPVIHLFFQLRFIHE